MAGDITLTILGDHGPFSRMGKSIGYRVSVGRSSFLLDCGSPLFQQIGGHGLQDIQGLIITHCHDDHKRWFTDLALFSMYAPDVKEKVFLLTSGAVRDELVRASGPSLETSLSTDSMRVVDLAFDDYVRFQPLGPRPKYRIVTLDEGNGRTALAVVDSRGKRTGPDRAKIVINPKTKRPRLLFLDPDCREWIEPATFYAPSADAFYEKHPDIYRDQEGFTIEAVTAPLWHGLPGIGVKFRTESATLIFSSDTLHDTALWDRLFREKRRRRLRMSQREFDAASVINGDINDYIERTWSEARYREAMNAFSGAAVVHDIAVRRNPVHTSYGNLHRTTLRKGHTLLTHGPDTMTSEWVLGRAGKTFVIRDDRFLEMVGGHLYPMDGDIYHKEAGRYYVGHRNPRGRYAVYDREGMLSVARWKKGNHEGFRVDLYEDLGGRYFPRLERRNAFYIERQDGRVELVEFSKKGSRGVIVQDLRRQFRSP